LWCLCVCCVCRRVDVSSPALPFGVVVLCCVVLCCVVCATSYSSSSVGCLNSSVPLLNLFGTGACLFDCIRDVSEPRFLLLMFLGVKKPSPVS
jgi:hypothetical protein